MKSTEGDKQRAQFVARISHDLKNILNPVIGFSSMMVQDPQGLSTEQQRQLKLVYGNAQQLLDRIDALVEFHRLRGGLIKVDADWISPAALLVQSAENFRAAAEEKHLSLQVAPASSPARVRTVLRLVSRVMRELLANAIRFTASGGITLRTLVSPAGRAGPVRLILSVEDTGMGLSPTRLRDLQEVLGPQAGESYQGLGLGLALAREASQLLGGRLDVQPGAGGGNVFSLQLDLSEGDVER